MSAKGAYFQGGGAYLHCGGRVLARILANSKKSIGFIDGSGGSYLSDLSRRDERHAHGLLTTHYYSLLSITHCSLLFTTFIYELPSSLVGCSLHFDAAFLAAAFHAARTCTM